VRKPTTVLKASVLTGVPHRIKYLEALYDHILSHEGVVMWTGAEILDWYRSQRSTVE
jgi:hypothetical protein